MIKSQQSQLLVSSFSSLPRTPHPLLRRRACVERAVLLAECVAFFFLEFFEQIQGGNALIKDWSVRVHFSKMDESSNAPDCSVTQRSAAPGQAQSEGSNHGSAVQGGRNGVTHEAFGDVNLGAAMLFLMLLHLLNFAMRDPCTC